MNRQSKYHLKCFVRVRSLPAQHNLGSSGHFPSLTSLLIVASSLHVLTFSTLCLGRFLICKIHSAFHSPVAPTADSIDSKRCKNAVVVTQ